MQIHSGNFTCVTGEVLTQYRCVVSALGQANLAPVLDAALSRLSKVRRWYFYRRSMRSTPAVAAFAYRHESALDEDIVRAYGVTFAHTDPITRVLERAQVNAATLAVSITPADVMDSVYRQRALQAHAIVQRLSVIHRRPQDCLIMQVTRGADLGQLEEREVHDLAVFGALVLPLLEQHAQLQRSHSPDLDLPRIEIWVQERCPRLTPREAQVCARAILGHSSKSIARQLGIGVESVNTYRKRAYSRLQVRSTEQLSRRILESGPRIPDIATRSGSH